MIGFVPFSGSRYLFNYLIGNLEELFIVTEYFTYLLTYLDYLISSIILVI